VGEVIVEAERLQSSWVDYKLMTHRTCYKTHTHCVNNIETFTYLIVKWQVVFS